MASETDYLIMLTPSKTSKVRITVPLWWESTVNWWYWPFVMGIHRLPMDSPHKGSVMRKALPYHDVIMAGLSFRKLPLWGRIRKYLWATSWIPGWPRQDIRCWPSPGVQASLAFKSHNTVFWATHTYQERKATSEYFPSFLIIQNCRKLLMSMSTA